MIQKNWQTLIKPKQLQVEPGDDPSRFATAVAEPLERGFGLTLGNALRCVLLSSLQGAAVTSVQIEGVLHEFSSIPGVLEDVTDIVLNIKGMGLRMGGEGPKRMRLRATGPGEVRAGQIETGHDIEIMNPDLVICTLDQGAKIAMEFTVESGKGYVAATQNRPEDAPIGLIPVDALFSPVRKVSYKVENSFSVTLVSCSIDSAWRRQCRPPRLPSVISFSTIGRRSFAFGRVVVICSCFSNAAAMLSNMALRCEEVRLNLRPLIP